MNVINNSFPIDICRPLRGEKSQFVTKTKEETTPMEGRQKGTRLTSSISSVKKLMLFCHCNDIDFRVRVGVSVRQKNIDFFLRNPL